MKNRTVLSLMAAANMLGIEVVEVKRMLKSGSLEAVDREGGLPGVSLCSVHAFKGEKCPEETRISVRKKTDKKDSKKENTPKGEKMDDKKESKEKTEVKEEQSTNKPTPKESPSDDKPDENTKPKQDMEKEIPAFDLDAMMQKAFPGIKKLGESTLKEMMGLSKCKKCEVKYNAHDLKDATDIAYKLGRLSVYEGMESFKRKKPEKLVKRKVK